MTTTKNTEIDNFIFETTIITTLSDIVTKLENREFRDCDIDWLNEKLKKYTELALVILNKKVNLGEIGGLMNDNNRARFFSYFNTLLKFFKSYE